MRFWQEGQSLLYKHGYETVMITPWGKNALRVRATKYPRFTENDWALEEQVLAAGNVEIVPYALGSSDPLLPNNSTANRRSNRRIEIFIVPNKLMLEMAKSNKLQ